MRILHRVLAACVLAASAVVPVAAQTAGGVERSIVRIVNFAQRGDWFTPWDVSQVAESSGSGFVIEGGLVMTNAHVVSDARLLVLFLHNDPNPHHAEVFRIGHDCDLALIRPLEPGLLDDVPFLRFGDIPELGSAVETIGHPAGGTGISSTRGIVSRIEEQLYAHSGADLHLSVQTDAAINPGNSGGPVLQGDLVVGVAFQAVAELQSVGYFIPTDVVGRFLKDVADGRYDGYPELGVETSGLENPAARRRAGMRDDETGVRVDGVLPDSSADGYVREGDVLLGVDDSPVANDGTISSDDLRFQFGLLVDRLQIGDSIKLKLLRDGERIEAVVPLRGYAHVHSNVYDELPRYFVYGGLVFIPLDIEMMKTFGPEWPSRGDKALIYEYLIRPREDLSLITRERIVLLRRLDHPVNADIAWHRNQLVERVNGREIHGLDDLIAAFEVYDGEFHFIEFASYGRFAVLHRTEAERAKQEILERYGVPTDRRL